MANSRYKLSATVDEKYAPLINRTRMLHEQTPKAEFPLLRERGATNIDLWADGSLYPFCPISNKRPNFRSISELLQFVGDGRAGLLGYTERLCKSELQFQFRLLEAEKEILSMREQILVLTGAANERDSLLQVTESERQSRERIVEENCATLVANDQLKREILALQEQHACTISSYESRLSSLIAESLEVDALKKLHDKKIRDVTSKLRRTQATLRRREKKLENLVKTPYGYRIIMRSRKDLSTLAPEGGHAKRTVRLARSMIALGKKWGLGKAPSLC